LFDKTGTLTTGHHVVNGIVAAGLTEDEVLALAAAIEADSEHPLARAVVAVARQRGLVMPIATAFRPIAGRGVEAAVDRQMIAVGGPALLRERNLVEPGPIAARTAEWRARGASVLHVVREGTIVGALTLEDEVRPESHEAIDRLHSLGIRAVMITGDAREVADAVGSALGIDEVFAEVLPNDKDRTVVDLQTRGLAVAMVGDGINDAPALTQADVGFAIGTGTDVAIEASDVTLVGGSLHGVATAIEISTATMANVRQNLVGAFVYNSAGLPLAAGVLYPLFGVLLSPLIAAAAMAFSSVTVVSNANRLRHWTPREART